MTRLLTVRACEQTPGDLAIMAEFPGVFTTGTQRVGVPERRSEQKANGKFYRQILPKAVKNARRTNGEGVENKRVFGLARRLQVFAAATGHCESGHGKLRSRCSSHTT